MAASNKHILIENVAPSLDGGRYPVKAIVGETCTVQADIFRDGTQPVRAVLHWRVGKNPDWSEILMAEDGNDRWRASFPLSDIGAYEFFIRAWSEGDGPRSDREETKPFRVVVDRPLAKFGAWYELFVRSQGSVPGRSGTFQDLEKRLPDIKAMGFDVIYLAPIHPIGRTARKGPNNHLNAGPNDPGSPWAVGNENGGHTAVEPALGTLKDFDKLVGTAASLGLELALDFVPHCSPDHPWVNFYWVGA